jgi:hypothetical protein
MPTPTKCRRAKLKSRITKFAVTAATIAAAYSVLRWMDTRHARLLPQPRKALESWENEGGTLSSPPNRIGMDISQVPS